MSMGRLARKTGAPSGRNTSNNVGMFYWPSPWIRLITEKEAAFCAAPVATPLKRYGVVHVGGYGCVRHGYAVTWRTPDNNKHRSSYPADALVPVCKPTGL